jgi:hypothetical protein
MLNPDFCAAVTIGYYQLDDKSTQRPLIIIAGERDNDTHGKLLSHYSQVGYERWNRLSKNQVWIYHDLHILFTKWDAVYATVKQSLNMRTKVTTFYYLC